MNEIGALSLALARISPGRTSMRPSAPMPTRRKTSPSQKRWMRPPGSREAISASIVALTSATGRSVGTVNSKSDMPGYGPASSCARPVAP